MTKAERLESIRNTIRVSCQKSGRKESDITLVAVSKTKPFSDVQDFAQLGVKVFGENYVQEALAKVDESKKANLKIDWHFIGTLQSNKAKFLPGNFSLFHGLDSESLATKLNQVCEKANQKMRCLVEVNIDEESSKGGIYANQIPDFLGKISKLQSIEILGFMCIPEASTGRKSFAKMRELLVKANQASLYPKKLTELSMGMSHDFAEAIEEGATLVRVGTLLFGERTKK